VKNKRIFIPIPYAKKTRARGSVHLLRLDFSLTARIPKNHKEPEARPIFLWLQILQLDILQWMEILGRKTTFLNKIVEQYLQKINFH
jgi:hypothetical protein